MRKIPFWFAVVVTVIVAFGAGAIVKYASAAGCNPFVVATGGTGDCAFVANTVLLGNGTGKIATTTQGTNGFVLALVNGVPTFVSTSSIQNLPIPITVPNGGTGAVILTGCLTGNGTSAITGSGTCVTSVSGTSNQITSSGGATPIISLPSLVIFPGQATTTQLSSYTGSYFGATGTTTITSTGFVGIGTSTPFAALSLDRNANFASSTIAINEYNYGTATSTSELIDCRSASDTHIRIGAAAETLTINSSSLIPGQKCIVITESPNGTAGAITWAVSSGGLLLWAGGTVPSQTTTANKMDVWSFLATTASTTKAILGAQTPNF